jgi:hypothetical protein
VRGDSLLLSIENDEFGQDPVNGVEKRLRVEYSFDSKRPILIERREHEFMVLPEDSRLKATPGELSYEMRRQQQLHNAELLAERNALRQCEENLAETKWNLEKAEKILSPLQNEILFLTRDLRKMRDEIGPAPELASENMGPMPTGVNFDAWMKQRLDDTGAWSEAYSFWARKFIYRYRAEFADRVKKVMNSLAATTGMLVYSLNGYASDVRPGQDFQKLIDILLGFVAKLEITPAELLAASIQERRDKDTIAFYEHLSTERMREVNESDGMKNFVDQAYDRTQKESESQ